MIKQAIKSTYVKKYLDDINVHFYNVKQERHIRDCLVKYINSQNGFSCYSEEPRQGGTKADMLIEYGSASTVVEIKYQYKRDLRVKHTVINPIIADINKKINGKCCDVFVLIIHERPGIAGFSSASTVMPIFLSQEKEEQFHKYFIRLCSYIRQSRSFKLTRLPRIRVNSPYFSIYRFFVFEF